MSFKTEVIKNDYVGNDSIATYAYGFKIDKEEHLRVIAFTDDNVETVLVLNTDYTVSGVGKKNGGSITLLASGKDYLDTGTANLATGYNLLIKSNAEYKQETDIRNNGDFFPEVHEDTFDYSRRLDLQLFETVKRCVQLKESEDAEVKIERGSFGEVLRWNNQRNLEGVLLGAVAFSNSYDDLSDKPDIAVLAPVQSVASKTGAVTLVKGDVGLGNVDNTSDSDKPVSSDQQAALNLKADASDVSNVTNTSDAQKVASGPIKDALDALTLKGLADVDGAGFTTVSVVTYNPSTQEFEAGASGGGGAVDSVNGEIGVVVLDKSDIGLGNVDNTSDSSKSTTGPIKDALDLKANASGLTNVDNTSDADKPVSTAQQTALDLKLNITDQYNTTIITGNYTLLDTDRVLVVDTISDITITLGDIGLDLGRSIRVYSNVASHGILTFERGSGGYVVIPAGNLPQLPETIGTDAEFLEFQAFNGFGGNYWTLLKRNSSVNIQEAFLNGTGVFNASTGLITGQTVFTLPFTPISKQSLFVFEANGRGVDSDEFSISGNQITFSSAPIAGTKNIYIRSIGSPVLLNVPADGSVTQAKLAADTSIQYATRYLAADISGSDVADIASLKFSNIPIGRKVVVSLTVFAQAVSENVIVNTIHDGNTISSFYIKDDDQGGVQSTILSKPFVTTSGVISFETSSIANANDIIRGDGTVLETHVTVYVYPNSALSENLGLI